MGGAKLTRVELPPVLTTSPISSDTPPPRRLCVIGVSGAGKTTLARRAAAILRVSHLELDALHWEPGWQEASTQLFRERVASATAAEGWTADGNYSKARDILWARADTLLWLDYSLPLVMVRLLRRTLARLLHREELWSGNRESLRMAFSRDSIILWALQTHPKYRREFPDLLARPEYAHLTIRRLRSPREADAWLKDLSRFTLHPQ